MFYRNVRTTLAVGALFGVLTLSGCISNPVQQAQSNARAADRRTPVDVDVDVPFEVREAQALMSGGRAQVVGAVYSELSRTGEDTLLTAKHRAFAPDTEVRLYPMTAHMRRYVELFQDYSGTSRNTAPGTPRGDYLKVFHGGHTQHKRFLFDPLVDKYAYVTRTDRHGNFRFRNLRTGQYRLVVAKVIARGSYTGDVVVGYTGKLEHTATRTFGWTRELYLDTVIDVNAGENEVPAEVILMPDWYHQYRD